MDRIETANVKLQALKFDMVYWTAESWNAQTQPQVDTASIGTVVCNVCSECLMLINMENRQFL